MARTIVFPEEKLPLSKIIPLGLQHVVAMFGATVLAPILMGFNPQTAVFFSGWGTLIFILITRGKIPSYLGSSFAFIGPVLAVTTVNGVTDPGRIPLALGGIFICGLCYALGALATIRFGCRWIEWLMPPVVTGAVVALIGLNLAGSSVSLALGSKLTISTPQDWRGLLAALTTLATSVIVAVYLHGFIALLPILCGVVAGTLVSVGLGLIDPAAAARIAEASWIGWPQFVTPRFGGGAAILIAPVCLVLFAENKGHIDAIGGYLGRDLSPSLGRAYLGDAVATMVSACGGGTPQTTYAENMGVMAITGMFAVRAFAAAATFAILLGLCPKFGYCVQAIPHPVLGGVTLILYGMITLMGIRIWQEAHVDFSQPRNMIIAGVSLTLATGLGVTGLTIGGVNVCGIAVGTLLALVLNLVLRPAKIVAEAAK